MIRVLLRRNRAALLAWTLSLLVLVAIVIPSYEATYSDPVSRQLLVDQMQATQGSKVLYGELPDPGTLGQLFAWETGSYVLILAAVMTVLLGIALTRGEEDSGTLELVRSVGVRPPRPITAAIAVLLLASGAIGAGSAAILVAQSAIIDELEPAGGAAFGGLLFVVSVAFGMVAVVCAQLRGDRRSARGLAFTVVAVTFGLRIAADFTGSAGEILRWLTPFGWRDLVRPYTDDRVWVLLVAGAVCLGLGGLGLALARRRELGSAWWGRSGAYARGLRVRSVWSWAWRDARGSIVGWSVAVLGSALLFGSMTGGLVTMLDTDPTTAALLEQLGGDTRDPVGTYFGFLGVFIALLVMICAVLLTLRWRGEEASGRIVNELAAGVPRSDSLLARVLVATAVSVGLSVAAGAIMGLIGWAQLPDSGPASGRHAMAYALAGTLGDLPGILAAIGVTALLIGIVPRLTPLIWIVVGGSGFLVLLGGLVDVPRRMIDLSLLGHSPGAGPGAAPDWMEWLTGAPWVLTAVALAGVLATVFLINRRDLRFG